MNKPEEVAEWPFNAPKNLAVITTKSIIRQGKPILTVSHDRDDGSRQFLDGTQPKTEEAMVVSLHEIAQHDPSIKALADLPAGWQAWRDTPTSAWRRGRHP